MDSDKPQLQTDTSRRVTVAGVFVGGIVVGIVATCVVRWLVDGAGPSGGVFDAEDWRGR
jgi:hypothetical protein